jgi:hypothetical protein
MAKASRMPALMGSALSLRASRRDSIRGSTFMWKKECARTEAPVEMCTGEPPEKSREPRRAVQPSALQDQRATWSYTRVDQKTMKMRKWPGRSFHAAAPASMAALPERVSGSFCLDEGAGGRIRLREGCKHALE